MIKDLLIIILFQVALADRFAILLSASTGYHNYRHQANICHTYNSLVLKGVPEDNIVLFTYDDAVYSEYNPFPGKLYSQPGLNPQNVNAGCKKDYTFEDVTPENFLYALTGDSRKVQGGTGRVLNTTQNDDIFVYVSTTSGPGFLLFPEGEQLYASVLNGALLLMKQNYRFNNLLFYLDTSEAGSIFHRLINRQADVYAVVSSSSSQSSFGTFCPPEDKVNGISMKTCLGTDFSSEFFQIFDQADISGITVNQQFIREKQRVRTSDVQEFGTLQIGRRSSADFMGNWVINTFAPSDEMPEKRTFWDSHDMKLDYLFNQYLSDSSIDTADMVIKEIFNRQLVTETFVKFAQKESINPDYLMILKEQPKNFDCLRRVVDNYVDECGQLTDHSSQFMQIVINVCEAGLNEDQIISDLVSECVYNLDEFEDDFDVPYNYFWDDLVDFEQVMDVLYEIQDQIDTREYIDDLIDQSIETIIDREVDYYIDNNYPNLPSPFRTLLKQQIRNELYSGSLANMLRIQAQSMIADQLDDLVDADLDVDYGQIEDLIQDYLDEIYDGYDIRDIYDQIEELVEEYMDEQEDEEEESLLDEIEDIIKDIINNIPNPFGN